MVEVDLCRVRVARSRPFGGAWLGLMLLRQLGLNELLETLLPSGRKEIPRSVMTLVLVLGRLLEPSSELHLVEHGHEASALAELLGAPAAKVNDGRLYRTLDQGVTSQVGSARILSVGSTFSLSPAMSHCI